KSLHQSTEGLAVHDRRIDCATNVLDRNVIKHLDMACAIIDCNVRRMRAVTVCSFCICECRLDNNCACSFRCSLSEPHRPAVGTKRVPIGNVDRIDVAPELNSGGFSDCLLKLLGGLQNCRATHYDSA